MVNLRILEKRGITPEKLKAKLKGASKDEKDPKLKKLRERIRSRSQQGIDDNFRNYKLYHALDLALNVPFRQTDQTLLNSLAQKDLSSDEIRDALNKWNLDTEAVFKTETVKDPKTGANIEKAVVDIPTFFQVHVPLCLAYLKIRQAKIMTDRRQVPHLKYEPAFSNAKARMRCEAVTSRAEVMSRQFGYWSVQDQCVFQMLHYQFAFKIPKEPWFREEQEDEEGEKRDDEEGDGLTGKKPKRKTRIVKEGIRYEVPLPTRVWWDRAHRVPTFNTDTGCEYFGYWRAMRWKDLQSNPNWWNLDKVSVGDTKWWSNASTFFDSVYASCQIKTNSINWNFGNNHDREANFISQFYTGDQDECPVVVTEYFEKLVPSECGLGDYDYPVWFRFILAGSDDAILYAEPWPYCPVIYYGLDTDQNRDLNPSLTLQIMPWQDHMSNFMSQFYLTVKQNLANVTFVDTDVMKDKGFLDWVKNLGGKLFSVMNFFPYSSKAMWRAQNSIEKCFQVAQLAKTDTTQLLMAMKTILDTVERVLTFSSQELGQAASHELRAQEVQNIAQTTSIRLKYTDCPVADAVEAWKRQIYYGLMSEGADEFYAEIPMENKITKEDLDDLGFTYDKKELPSKRGRDKKATVKVKKDGLKPLLYEGFTSSRDADDRTNSTAQAAAMMQALGPILQNEMVMQMIGDQVIPLLNEIFLIAGFPRDFKLQNNADHAALSQGEVEQIMQLLQQFQQEMTGKIAEGMKPVVEQVQQTAEATAQTQEAVKVLASREQMVEEVIGRLSGLLQRTSQTNGNGSASFTDPAAGRISENQAAIMA